MSPEDALCPSCNESIGISVAWCAACAAWFGAVKEGVCTVDSPYAPIHDDLTIGDMAL